MSDRSDRHVWWSLILYADSTSYHYKGILERLIEWCDEYYYIVHDKETVKPHTHFIAKLRDSKQRDELIKHLFMRDDDFVERNDETVKFINAYKKQDAIVYLTHLNSPDKYQYPFEDVITNKPDTYKKIITAYKARNLDPYKELYEFIKLSDSDVEITDVLDYAYQIDQIKVAMKYYYPLLRMCDNYNVIRHTRKGHGKENG